MNRQSILSVKPGSKIYLMGICGTAMSSLAGLLKEMGFKVTGSDQNAYPPMSDQLDKIGIKYFTGYAADNLRQAQPDFVIVGNVISKTNVEISTLLELNLPITSLPQALGELFLKNKKTQVVSGTHGKTTTTSALSWCLSQLTEDPGFLIGGIPQNFNRSFSIPKGDFFAIEGDEYDTAFFDKVPKFTHYYPQQVILTSVEFDHADIYDSLDTIKKAFRSLIDQIPSHGTLVYFSDDLNIQEIISSKTACQLLSYGFSEQARVQISNVGIKEGLTYFSLNFKDLGQTHQFVTSLYGNHNIANLTAVIALLYQVHGFSVVTIQKAITTFLGVKRRQEWLGEPGGVGVIEDFAHHPTAVKETIQGLRLRFPERKLWVIFEPRSATSRRNIFQQEYALAFSGAQEVILMEAFDQSKINQTERLSVSQVVSDLRKEGQSAHCFLTVDEIINHVGERAKPSDLIVIMSNGGFDAIYSRLMNRLQALSNSDMVIEIQK